MSEVINLNKESFKKVINDTKPTLVDFWAPWCGPCLSLSPILEEIANDLGDSVGVYKVNIDENTDLAQEHGVRSIPTILVYKNAALSDTLEGFKTKDELLSTLQS